MIVDRKKWFCSESIECCTEFSECKKTPHHCVIIIICVWSEERNLVCQVRNCDQNRRNACADEDTCAVVIMFSCDYKFQMNGKIYSH